MGNGYWVWLIVVRAFALLPGGPFIQRDNEVAEIDVIAIGRDGGEHPGEGVKQRGRRR